METTMNDDKIVYNKDGSLSALHGKDAVSLMRVATIICCLKMAIATNGRMILTRGATPTRLLQMATEYTGQKYKRTEKERAIQDLKVWMETMKSALPTEVR